MSSLAPGNARLPPATLIHNVLFHTLAVNLYVHDMKTFPPRADVKVSACIQGHEELN